VQPLEKIKWESSEGTVVDYEPAEGDTFKVELVGAYNHYNMEKVHIELNPKNNKRNLLTYENNGTLPLGLYDIEISVTLADGKRLHSCQPKRVKIVKTNSEASIPDYVEFGIETFTLQGEPFMYVPTGEGGGDMSNYYTKTESDARFLSNSTPIPSASDTTPLMDGVGNSGSASTFARADHRHPSDTTKQDVINDLADIRSGASKGNTAYQKPSSGILKTDLESSVQTSLEKADNAIQKSSSSTGLLKPNGEVDNSTYLTQHQDISGKANTSDLSNVAFSGRYDDLDNKPTIPAAGDVNVIEEVQVNGVALTPDANKAVNVQVPTNTNQLTNGAGYITSAQVPSNYPLISQSALTVQIAPNTFNVWSEPISNDLTITLGAEVSGVMNEYLMQFSIASGVTPQVTFPSNLQWTGIDTFQGGKTYQVSIVNGYAIGVEFDTITQS
jgi:hypothetical protein